MADKRRHEQTEAVVAAARRYRDAMRRYFAEQADLIDQGLSLDDLITRNWDGFAQAAAAEEDLFALLDALDADERGPA
jgi:hypothetical protein